MNSIVDLCLLCLTNNENQMTILSSQDIEGIVIEEKCRFVLNEHVNIKPDVSYICSQCLQNLNFVYSFKQKCMQNIIKFNNYVDTFGTDKLSKVTVTDPKYGKEIVLTCDNEPANEISLLFEEVAKEEIADDSVMQVNDVLEEDKAMHKADEFSGKIKFEDFNDGSNMQYSSSLCENKLIENFLTKVKKETDFKVIPEEINIKYEQIDNAKVSDSESTNTQYSSSLCEDRHIETFLTKVKKETDFKVTAEEIHIKDEQIDEAKVSDSEATNTQYSSSFCEDRHIETFPKNIKKETEIKAISEEEQLSETSDCDSDKSWNDKLQNEEANSADNVSTSSSSLGTYKTVKKPRQSKKKRTSKNPRQYKKKKPKEIICDVCNKSFTRRAGLKIHRRIHTGERPFECKYCEKAFSARYSLQIHTLTHTGEKPHKCDICNKAFIEAKHLLNHKRMHTGEKPYECDVCNKAFSTKCILNVHKRIHTGKGRYGCDVCKKTFYDKYILKAHTRLHTGERPFECDVCKKGFITVRSLKIHTRIHTEKKAYECDLCQKSYNLQSYLLRHKTRSHHRSLMAATYGSHSK